MTILTAALLKADWHRAQAHMHTNAYQHKLHRQYTQLEEGEHDRKDDDWDENRGRERQGWNEEVKREQVN